jgi:Domain of unknown function (DUF397)
MTQPDGRWFKSSFSGSSGCVEVRMVGAEVHVRDSKNPSGSVLIFTRAEWCAFLEGAEAGEFSLHGD